MYYQLFITWLHSSAYGLLLMVFIPIFTIFLLIYFRQRLKNKQNQDLPAFKEEDQYLKSKKSFEHKTSA